jgi:hypothetical protein
VKEQGEGNTKAILAVHRAAPAFAAGEGVVDGEEGRGRSAEETQRLCADPTHPRRAFPTRLGPSMPLR